MIILCTPNCNGFTHLLKHERNIYIFKIYVLSFSIKNYITTEKNHNPRKFQKKHMKLSCNRLLEMKFNIWLCIRLLVIEEKTKLC